MLRTFLRHYLELPPKLTNIVCLGGGVGTSQVLKGLRNYPHNLTAIVSMADDGGSAGRLRRTFAVPPPGDLVNCLAALSDEESVLKKLFVFRFAGKRYGKDTDLSGQKLGNLIFVALTQIYNGNSSKALEEFSRIISSRGKVLPATIGDVNIWAITKSGKRVYGEQNIDLGKYNGDRTLKRVYLAPAGAKAYKGAIEAIKQADLIVAGPGDLFSTVLPVLIVPAIKNALKHSPARKFFIVNVANKPFETAGFAVSDYLDTLKEHLSANIFDTILVNTNQKPKIPANLKYKYVKFDHSQLKNYKKMVFSGDFIDREFPIYHDSHKIAKAIEAISQ